MVTEIPEFDDVPIENGVSESEASVGAVDELRQNTEPVSPTDPGTPTPQPAGISAITFTSQQQPQPTTGR